jgi:RNA polymerase sigma-70 factor (ECF subfamily)
MIDTVTEELAFSDFVRECEPRLRRALAGHLPADAVGDALAEAFAYAWEHWSDVASYDNAAGFLFRVAQSRSRRRRRGHLPAPDLARTPQVEPGLLPAMRALAPMQRSCVWLVHGCGWTYRETGEALGVTASAVGTHVSRAMANLRRAMGVDDDE